MIIGHVSLMSSGPNNQRITISLSGDLVGRIDDWMFANRIKGRSGAIRQLIELALSDDESREGDKEDLP